MQDLGKGSRDLRGMNSKKKGKDRAALKLLNKGLRDVVFWCTFIKQVIAGWSSLVARQAHNLKVVGSNPTPATTGDIGTGVFLDPPAAVVSASAFYHPVAHPVAHPVGD